MKKAVPPKSAPPALHHDLISADAAACHTQHRRLKAGRFIRAQPVVLAQAYQHIGQHPATGSPRDAHELKVPGLHSWPLSRFPHMVFYMACPDRIDVWRVLHGQRDIPIWMQAADDAF